MFLPYRDRQNMGNRYLEVFQGKRSEYYEAIASVSVMVRHKVVLFVRSFADLHILFSFHSNALLVTKKVEILDL